MLHSSIKTLALFLMFYVGFGSVTNADNHSSMSANFNRLVGVDLFGDDLTSMGIKGISLAKCEAICSEDSSCKAYSFIEDKKWCFPKSGPGQVQPNGNVISGLRARQEPDAECLIDVSNSKMDKPSELALVFCRSGLRQLANIEMLVSDNTTNNNLTMHEKFKIKHKVLGRYEDWIFVYLEETESEYDYSEIVGFNCSNNNFEELNIASYTPSGEWMPNFLQYAVILKSVCGFEGDFLKVLDAYATYCNFTHNRQSCFTYFSSAKNYLSVAIAKEIQKNSADLSVWSAKFWNGFETAGCSECGSNIAEIFANASILSDDQLNFLIDKYHSLFGKIANVSITDLRRVDDDDLGKLWAIQ